MMRSNIRQRILLVIGTALSLIAVYLVGASTTSVARAQATANYAKTIQGEVPKSYGRLAATFADSIGTGLVFEDAEGVIRFVSVTGMKEGELARYEGTPTHGGIPKSYGHLVGAVVNNGSTGLVFEDAKGVIRFVTLTGTLESELTRN
jgi:hypothetical protein